MPNMKGAFHKHQKNVENVVARKELLLQSIKQPGATDKRLIAAIATQRSFVSLSLASSSIQKLSLNTCKSIANDLFGNQSVDGEGFSYLDDLRRKLKKSVSGNLLSCTAETRLKAYQQEILVLKQKLESVDLLNLQRSNAYLDLYRRIVSIAAHPATDEVSKFKLTKLIQNHRKIFGPLFSPTGENSNRKLRMISEDS